MTPAGNNPPGNQGLKHEALFKKLVRFLSSSLHLFLLYERMSGAFPRRNTKIKGFSRAGWADTHTMLSTGAGTGLTRDFRVGFDVTCPERPLLTSPGSHRPSPTTLPGLPAAAGPICRYRRRSAVTQICRHTDGAQKMTTCARGSRCPGTRGPRFSDPSLLLRLAGPALGAPSPTPSSQLSQARLCAVTEGQ